MTEDVAEKCGDYTCKYDGEIEEFFKSEYKDYNTQLLGKSYCFVTRDEHPKLACAFSLANSSVRVDRLSNKKRNKINRGIPNAKRRSQYPAVLIGQLAVMDGFHGQDLGSKVLDFIKSWFIDPQNKTGCRYIVVDAVNTEKVLTFYEKNGFKYIFASDEEEMNYMSGINGNSLWTKFLKMLGLKKADPIFRKTRLMYFDLIVLFSKK
jgi:GNAT superfamily N-acetyltransferase